MGPVFQKKKEWGKKASRKNKSLNEQDLGMELKERKSYI